MEELMLTIDVQGHLNDGLRFFSHVRLLYAQLCDDRV
jgi:hypothetical protein